MGARETVCRILAVLLQLTTYGLALAFILLEVFKYGAGHKSTTDPSHAIIGRVMFSVGICMSYLFYLLTCMFTETRSFLSNSLSSFSVYEYIHGLQQSAPNIVFHVCCYHWRTVTRTVTDSNGRTRTETSTQRVVTYQESRPFRYQSWEDVSKMFLLSIDEKQARKNKPCLKLFLRKNWILTDETTLKAYRDAQASIVADNRWRDQHMDYSEHMEIPDFKSYVLAFVGDRRPKFFGSVYFYLSMFTMLCVPYCLYVDHQCYTQDFVIEKRVSVLPSIQIQPNFTMFSVSEGAPLVYDNTIQNPNASTAVPSPSPSQLMQPYIPGPQPAYGGGGGGYGGYGGTDQPQPYVPPTQGYQQSGAAPPPHYYAPQPTTSTTDYIRM